MKSLLGILLLLRYLFSRFQANAQPSNLRDQLSQENHIVVGRGPNLHVLNQ